MGFYTRADLSERARSYTLPDRGAGQGYAGWLKLSTGAQTPTHTGQARHGCFSILTEEEERVSQIPPEQEQT